MRDLLIGRAVDFLLLLPITLAWKRHRFINFPVTNLILLHFEYIA